MSDFTPLVDQQEIADAWATFCEQMQRGSVPFERLNGWRGGGGTYTVHWQAEAGIWTTLGTDWEHGRHWCGLGTDNPVSLRNLNQACQINPPIAGVNRRCAGLFVRGAGGAVYVTHSGKVGGGRKGIGKATFTAFYTKGEVGSVNWPRTLATDAFVIGRIDADDLVASVALFVHTVERYKRAAVSG